MIKITTYGKNQSRVCAALLVIGKFEKGKNKSIKIKILPYFCQTGRTVTSANRAIFEKSNIIDPKIRWCLKIIQQKFPQPSCSDTQLLFHVSRQ